MAQKRLCFDHVLEKLVGDKPFSDEEEDGGSAPDSCSEDLDLEGNDAHENTVEDEDKEPSNELAPLSFSSSESEAEQTTPRGGHRGRGRRRSPATAASPISPADLHPNGWQTEEQPDTLPEPLPMFRPARPPGVQGFGITDNPRPSDLFKTFFDEKTVEIICDNTNKQAKKNLELGKKFKWHDIGPTEFFKFVGLLFYMAVLKLPQVSQYWKKGSFFSVISPGVVMARNTFQAISANLHMSDPEKDAQNDQEKGTPNYDPLHRLKPLHNHIKNVCKAFYHPRQNLSIDERMVATKAKLGMRQYIKNKPTKYGIKLFVLADSSNGYTIDFTVYAGRSHFRTGEGVSFDSVMNLIDSTFLGSGYHLYCDNYYTSPKLFKELLSLKVRACGTYRDIWKGNPTTKVNAITKKSRRGTIRWIRDGPMLFTKWMDSREVSICSTIHTVYAGETVERRAKGRDGKWHTEAIPAPTPVTEYNKHMGGVDLSDQLIQYYSVHHRTARWYKIIFQHFLDIAATNAYIMHKELCQKKQKQPMTHLKFIETLAVDLCGCLDNGSFPMSPTPATPSRSSIPGTPSKLATPATPSQSAIPGTPSKLATPATPSQSAIPGTPSKFATPATPSQSAAPATPSSPASIFAPLSSPPSPELERTSDSPVAVRQSCLPLPINLNPQQSTKATEGRRQCVHCKKKTAWRCRNCRVALCLIIDRNCFADWHDASAK